MENKGRIKQRERCKKKNNFLVMADGGENHFVRSRLFVHSSSPTKIDYVSILLIKQNPEKSSFLTLFCLD